ncbi:urease accessory protein UreD [Cohnella silvisoli]|uniref:Urease accessory protein UreD n=1 Tax=Cohnella silvisoli TaxID=2873699 RepID=A0ABV1KWA2_9BACL|nr:urease accessory protein UreD [Cohnella silvisoli]MCD9023074.1 urease accessory protein UreD [Cohnella silvisoli]
MSSPVGLSGKRAVMRPSSSLAEASTIEQSVGLGAGVAAVTERLSELRAVIGLVNGRSELVTRYHSSPLKIAKTFRLDNQSWRQLAVVQMDGSPGLLEGDRYVLDWHLQEGTRLYATNQAYTRVHPCDSGDSRLRQRFRLEPGAVLEWIPEPVMLFRDAKFVAETEVDLAEGAICMLSDIFCPGRMSRGEAFAFRSYDAKVTVRYKGELMHYQRLKWEPAALPLDNAGCFGSFTHIGAFSIFSDRVNAEAAIKVREMLESKIGEPEGLSWGIARTAKHGLVVQVAGNAAWKLQRLLLAAWDVVRLILLDQPPIRLLKEAWMSGINEQ